MRRMKLRKVKKVVQHITARKWLSQKLNSGPMPKLMFLPLHCPK
jgi:hypothetical protein